MSEENITDKEEFIKIVGILSFSDVHPTDCKYITNFIIDLAKENQQLKEQLKDENNYHNEAVKWYKEAFDTEQERIKYKSVLDEIRECTRKYCSGIFTDDGEIVFVTPTANIVQILDKVKE